MRSRYDLFSQCRVSPAPHYHNLNPFVLQTSYKPSELFRTPAPLRDAGRGEYCDKRPICKIAQEAFRHFLRVGRHQQPGRCHLKRLHNAKWREEMKETLLFIILMGVRNGMGEKSAPLVCREPYECCGSGQPGDNGRKTMPLLGVDDDVIAGTQ